METLLEWLEPLRDPIIAYLVECIPAFVIGLALGMLGMFSVRKFFFEARPSQPIINNVSSQPIINNVYFGERTPSVMGDVAEIKTLTQAQYDAIANKSESTLYLIVDRTSS